MIQGQNEETNTNRNNGGKRRRIKRKRYQMELDENSDSSKLIEPDLKKHKIDENEINISLDQFVDVHHKMDGIKDHILVIEGENKLLKQKYLMLMNQNDELMTKFDKIKVLQEEINSLATNKIENDQRVNILMEDNEVYKVKVNSMKNEMDELKEKFTTLQKQTSDKVNLYGNKLEANNQESILYKKELKTLNEMVNGLRNDLKSEKQKVKILEKEKADINILKQKLEAKTKKIITLEKRINALMSTSTYFNDLITAKNIEIVQLKKRYLANNNREK